VRARGTSLKDFYLRPLHCGGFDSGGGRIYNEAKDGVRKLLKNNWRLEALNKAEIWVQKGDIV